MWISQYRTVEWIRIYRVQVFIQMQGLLRALWLFQVSLSLFSPFSLMKKKEKIKAVNLSLKNWIVYNRKTEPRLLRRLKQRFCKMFQLYSIFIDAHDSKADMFFQRPIWKTTLANVKTMNRQNLVSALRDSWFDFVMIFLWRFAAAIRFFSSRKRNEEPP